MADDLVKRARHNAQSDMPHHASVALIDEMADRIEELEECLQAAIDDAKEAEAYAAEMGAKLAKSIESLTIIDALDPEGFVNGCSQSALIGLVSRMGAIARTTLAELSRVSYVNANGEISDG